MNLHLFFSIPKDEKLKFNQLLSDLKDRDIRIRRDITYRNVRALTNRTKGPTKGFNCIDDPSSGEIRITGTAKAGVISTAGRPEQKGLKIQERPEQSNPKYRDELSRRGPNCISDFQASGVFMLIN